MFRAATEWALEERLPVVYLAANSGARVGLANEVKQCLRVRAPRPRSSCLASHALVPAGVSRRGVHSSLQSDQGCAPVAPACVQPTTCMRLDHPQTSASILVCALPAQNQTCALRPRPPAPQVEWSNPGDPTKGFRYLYLSPEDHAALSARSRGAPVLKAQRLVTEEGEERYRLTGGWGSGGSPCGRRRRAAYAGGPAWPSIPSLPPTWPCRFGPALAFARSHVWCWH